MTIQDLKDRDLILLECVSGSKAYGLDTPESDTDIKGVFYLPKEAFYGFEYIPQIANETNDIVYYELGRYLELLTRNNPNILELLATPEDCVHYKHPIMSRIRPEDFLSRLCRETFAGYALTQIRKARGYKKKIVNPVERGRKAVPDFCFVMEGHTSVPLQSWLSARELAQTQCGLSSIPHAKGLYALFADGDGSRQYSGIINGATSNDVSLSSIPKGETQIGYLFFNKEAYSGYCKEYREYWEWVEKRNDARYDGNMAHGKAYDAKNMMHTIRLLQVAEEILRDGVLRVNRPNREELLAIKRGDRDYDDLLQLADELMARIEEADKHTTLPDAPDREAAQTLLIELREELFHK